MRAAAQRYEERDRRHASSYQLELGTKSLLSLLFALAIVCGLFFAFGYTLGKHAIPAQFTLGASPRPATATAATSTPAATNGVQPPNPVELGQAETNQTPDTLTATPGTTTADGSTAPSATPAPTTGASAPAAAIPAPAAASNAANGGAAAGAAAASGVFHVQVFAGAQSDAQSLASALLARGYPATVAPPAPGDVNLYRVQVGPYLTPDEAQAMRSRLVADGYPAIVKNQ